MEKQDGYYTLKGYSLMENKLITSSMEDYLEMMFRLQVNGKPVRIQHLSEKLHVKPSSASKMVQNLVQQELAAGVSYGQYLLTETGLELGAYLVRRHEILHRLLCAVNRSDNELEQVEKIEHFIDRRTVENIQAFLDAHAQSPSELPT